MTFGQAIRSCLSKYVTFSGRAARSEFWWWVLFVFVGQLVLLFVDSALFGRIDVTSQEGSVGFQAKSDMPVLTTLFMLAMLLPSISVMVRRLHDTGHSGWWYWIGLVPFVGFILLQIWFIQRGTEGRNAYGPDPLGAEEFVQSPIPRVDGRD